MATGTDAQSAIVRGLRTPPGRACLCLVVFLSTLFLIAMSPAPAFPQEAPATEPAVFSITTNDGLVVLHGDRESLDAIRGEIIPAMPAGAANRDVLAFISRSGLADRLKTEAYVSMKLGGESGRPKIQRERLTVRQAVNDGKIPQIEGKPLYEAYMLARMRGDTLLLLGEQPAGPGVQRTVFVFSSAGMGLDGIYLDGNDVSGHVAGYNIVALAPEGGVSATASFETFSDLDSGSKMQRFLEQQPEDAVVLASSRVGPGPMLTPGAVAAMRLFGSAADPNPQILSSHALIGSRGTPPGKALEQTAVNASSEEEAFSESLYITEEAAQTLESSPGTRMVAISGTAPEDTVIIIGAEF